jgi:hypothetical protein
VEEKVEAGELARDTTEEAEKPAAAATGAQVIDLAELLSRSIKVANKPGPAKAVPEETKEEAARPEKAKGTKKKRATG